MYAVLVIPYGICPSLQSRSLSLPFTEVISRDSVAS